MPYEAKDGRGVLFRNRAKVEGDNAVDYSGDITVDGVKWRLFGRVNQSASGKFLALSAVRDQSKADKIDPKLAALLDRGLIDLNDPNLIPF